MLKESRKQAPVATKHPGSKNFLIFKLLLVLWHSTIQPVPSIGLVPTTASFTGKTQICYTYFGCCRIKTIRKPRNRARKLIECSGTLL